jgi:hypothetical protein
MEVHMPGLIKRFTPALALGVGLAASPAGATADLTLDARTITELLVALTPSEVQFPVPALGNIAVQISDIRVRGFAPGAGSQGKGQVLTALRLRSRQLGMDISVEPRLGLEVVRRDGQQVCRLRFDEVEIPVPIVGTFDIAGVLPPIEVPADNVWAATGARGDFDVRSQLVGVKMSDSALRLQFDVTVVSIAGAPR